MKLRTILMSALLGATALAAPVEAAPVSITNVQVFNYEGITLHDGILGSGNASYIGIAGQIVLTTDIGILGTWCVDLFHEIYLGGQYTYTPGPLVTDNTGSTPGTSNPLSASQIHDIMALAAYGNGLMQSAPSNALSAAIQAAIWDVEYGTTATGSAAFTTALSGIMAELPHLPAGTGYQLFNNDGGQGVYHSQGQFVSTGPDLGGTATDVPEPESLAMFGAGLLSMLGFGKRRRKA